MATAAVTNQFTASTTIVSDDVDTNFGDLVTFLNGSVVHKDGANYFTTPPVTGDADTAANSGGALTSTSQTQVTLAFTMPTGWSTAKIIAQGSVGAESIAVTKEIIVRVVVDGSPGTEAPSGLVPADGEPAASATKMRNVTGDCAVDIQAKMNSGTEDRAYATISYIAIRLT